MIGKLTIPALAAAMMIGSAGLALAQSSAPIPTGSAGNSNTGPGAHRLGAAATATPTTGRRTKASRASRNTPVRANTPMPTGSAGNSNTGPGAKPPQ
jgi:hypothetical protein